jgi:hypothetical protein
MLLFVLAACDRGATPEPAAPRTPGAETVPVHDPTPVTIDAE